MGKHVITQTLFLVLIVMPGKRHILSHPVVNARLSQLRLATTNPKDFREVGCTTPNDNTS